MCESLLMPSLLVKVPKVEITDPSAPPIVDSKVTSSLPLHGQLAATTVVTLGRFAASSKCKWRFFSHRYFYFFIIRDILVDPTAEELDMCESQVTVVTNEHGHLCGVFKQGICFF